MEIFIFLTFYNAEVSEGLLASIQYWSLVTMYIPWKVVGINTAKCHTQGRWVDTDSLRVKWNKPLLL